MPYKSISWISVGTVKSTFFVARLIPFITCSVFMSCVKLAFLCYGTLIIQLTVGVKLPAARHIQLHTHLCKNSVLLSVFCFTHYTTVSYMTCPLCGELLWSDQDHIWLIMRSIIPDTDDYDYSLTQ